MTISRMNIYITRNVCGCSESFHHLGAMEHMKVLMDSVRTARDYFDPDNNSLDWQILERSLIDLVMKHACATPTGPQRADKSPSQDAKKRKRDPLDFDEIIPTCKIPKEDFERLHPEIISYLFKHYSNKRVITKYSAEEGMKTFVNGTHNLTKEHFADKEGPEKLRHDFAKNKFSKACIDELIKYRTYIRCKKNTDAKAFSTQEALSSVAALFTHPAPPPNATPH